MAKELRFDIEARDNLKKGIDALANAVKVTLGPKGRNVVIEKKVSYEKQLYSNIHIGGEWKEYYARTKVAASLAQSEMSLLFHIGFPSQTVEVANVRFLNYQNTLSLEDLPETEITYVGQAMDAEWRGPADERIAQIRKGAATIKVYDEAGELLEPDRGAPAPDA